MEEGGPWEELCYIADNGVRFRYPRLGTSASMKEGPRDEAYQSGEGPKRGR